MYIAKSGYVIVFLADLATMLWELWNVTAWSSNSWLTVQNVYLHRRQLFTNTLINSGANTIIILIKLLTMKYHMQDTYYSGCAASASNITSAILWWPQF